MATVERAASIPVPADAIWDVLADFGSIARWAPNVAHSCLLGAVGADPIGRVRRIQTGRTVVLETVTAWEPGARLGYDITGLPAIAGHVHNEWRLTPSGGRTEVTLCTSVDAGGRPPRRLVARVVALRLAGESDAMLAGLTTATRTTP